MSDNSYGIEIKPASKNGYFTPDESRGYYGRYARTHYIVHWWGNGQGADGHDGVADYCLRTASQGNMSVNYILSDNKITLEVNPDNVSWGAQSGNAIGINVEHQPTLGDEGYKKSGWLKEQLEQRYGRRLVPVGHNAFFATACPGTVSLDRIEQECDKWRRGVYDQPPVPPPVVTPPTPAPVPPVAITAIPERKMYTLPNAKLVNIKDMSVVKVFPVDTEISISAKANYNGKDFLLSTYATAKSTGQGFLVGDLKESIEAPPVPTTPPPAPTPPTAPDYVTNLRNIDDTPYWLTKDQPLIDITTGKPTGTKTFKKDDNFVGSALTASNGVEYRITEYSFTKGIFNGIPISSLTLTPPTVPNIPPVPSVEQRLTALEALVAKIVEFLSSIFSNFKK